MIRPPPADPAFLEFLASLIEKMLTAGVRSEDISAGYLTLSKDVQREVEGQNRQVAKVAAPIVASRLRSAGFSSDDWSQVPPQVVESAIKGAIKTARKQVQEADDVEPEESRHTS